MYVIYAFKRLPFYGYKPGNYTRGSTRARCTPVPVSIFSYSKARFLRSDDFAIVLKQAAYRA